MNEFDYCLDCGVPISNGKKRCRRCEQTRSNKLGDWHKPVFDGPSPPRPLENLNTENSGE